MTATTAPEIHELATRAGVTLFDYQQEFLDSVVHSAQPLRSCLFYKTGAGKSLTALAAIALLGYDTCLVICPPSTHSQWVALGEKLGVTVDTMSHAKFRRKTVKVSRVIPVIADEFHLFGGQKGQGWRKLDKLARHLQAPLILASATPNYNDAERCYCVQHVLVPHQTKGGYLQFLYENCTTEQNPFGMEPIVTGFKNYPDAAAFLADIPGVFHLPDDLVIDIMDVPYREQLNPDLVTYGYDRLNHRMIASLMERRHTFRYRGLIDERGNLRTPILRELVKIVNDSPYGRTVMIFTTHSSIAQVVSETLTSVWIKNVLVTGSTSRLEKNRIIDEVRAGNHKVLIGTATLATGTDGLDRVCDTLVILDDTDDDALRRQLIGRIMPRGDYVSSTAKQILRFVPTP